MKLARYSHDGRIRSGVVHGASVSPFEPSLDVLTVLGLDQAARDEVAQQAMRTLAIPLADVSLLAPFEPRTIRDFLAFQEHVEELAPSVKSLGGNVPAAWFEAPTFYFGNPYSALGPSEPVEISPGSKRFDYEAEVAFIVGRTGRDLTPEQGWDYLAGATVMNDFSARDLQFREMETTLGPCKGKDGAMGLGPWVVTMDELEPYLADGFLRLGIWASVNGVEIGRDWLSNMAWTPGALAAYASRGTEIRLGDVLGSGTCAGGCLAEFWSRNNGELVPPPLQPGDTTSITVQGIGTLTHRIVPAREIWPIPGAVDRPRDRPGPRPETTGAADVAAV